MMPDWLTDPSSPALVLEILRDTASWVLLTAGAFFYVVGAIGLNRMPDLFTRMHANSVGETLGAALLVLGMIVQAGFTLVTVKLVVILAVILYTGSVATHALARAAMHAGERPLLKNEVGNLEAIDPAEAFPELAVRFAEATRERPAVERMPKGEG